MHFKNIKAIIRKQLKTYYRNWKRLTKKEKKSVAKKVLDEVVKGYDLNKEIKTAKDELLGIEGQLPSPGIINLDEMDRFIDSHENDILFKLNRKSRHPLYIKDEELRFIDNLPEISYRKYCGEDKSYKGHKENSGYIGMENKQNRAFIGLPLNRKRMISHVQMSQFRSSLSFTQLVNLTVYILYHFKGCGLLDESIVHCVDSTELPLECQPP